MKYLVLLLFLIFNAFGQMNTNEDVINHGKSGNEASINFANGTGHKLISKPDGTLGFDKGDGKVKKFGTGTGGSGGSNYNNAFTDDDNANAEDGVEKWTATAGSFTTVGQITAWATATLYNLDDLVVENGKVYKCVSSHTSGVFTSDSANWELQFGAGALEGDNSFVWLPSAQNDILDSPVLDLDRDIFRGRACQVQVEYIGGDENLTLQVLDADNDIIVEKSLVEHETTSHESIFFLCPDSNATANDFDLRIRIINAGVSASSQIKFDKAYLGTLIGLSETTTPDVCSFKVSNNGVTATIVSQNGGCVQSVSRFGPGRVNMVWTPGYYTVAPSMTVTTVNETGVDAYDASIGNNIITPLSTSGGSVEITAQTTSAVVDRDFEVVLVKQGVDAKQSIQVYKTAPRAIDFENKFRFIVSSGTGVVSDQEPVQTISGSCVYGSPISNHWNCPVAVGTFSSLPFCHPSPNSNRGIYFDPGSSTTTNLVFYGFNTTNNAPDTSGFLAECTKTGNDFKTLTEKPILVNQVETSVKKGVSTESCSFVHNSSPTTFSENGMCESWIESLTRVTCPVLGGNCTRINFTPGTFTQRVVCSPKCAEDGCANGGSKIDCTTDSSANDGSLTYIKCSNGSGASFDVNVDITCRGVR